MPVPNCPDDITISNDPGQCGAVVNYPPPSVTDACGVVASLTCSPPSGSTFPIGTTIVECTAMDANGNQSSCSFTVTVNDTELPTITCPADITVFNDPWLRGAIVNYSSPTVSDNCPGVTFSCSPSSGSFFPVGTTTVTCTATDASGNTATCSFMIRVRSRNLQCIRVQKIYDWVVLTNQDRKKVSIPAECFAFIENCRSEGKFLTATCREVEGTGRCDVLSGSRPVSTVPNDRIVTISSHVKIRIEFFCDNVPLCHFDVPINFVKEVVLCFPEGTDINCRIFDIQCRVLIDEELGNMVILEVVMCKDVQVEADVKMEIEADFCGPRKLIPMEEKPIECTFPTFPKQCPD
jgi:hypothetical protein